MGRNSEVTLTNEDGTKNNPKRGIDDPTKETRLQLAIGGSEDGGSENGVREQSWRWTRHREPAIDVLSESSVLWCKGPMTLKEHRS